MIELRPYRVYLFDIDGTLLNCGDLATKAVFSTMAEEFGVTEFSGPPSFCGRTDRGILADLFKRQGIDDTECHNTVFYEGYTKRLRQLMNGGQRSPLPGVTSTLSSLQALSAGDSRLLTIMTGNCRLGAGIKLEGYGIADFFALEQGGFGDDHHVRNDLAAATYAQLTRSEVKLNPDEILVIGDTVADIECARHIGVDCLAVATGTVGMDELKGADPRYLVSTLEQVRWT